MDYAKQMAQGCIGGAQIGGNTLNELGIIERAAGVVSGLQGIHAKLSNLREKIEGAGGISAGASSATPCGLVPQLIESESILSACHSLLDDITAKL